MLLPPPRRNRGYLRVALLTSVTIVLPRPPPVPGLFRSALLLRLFSRIPPCHLPASGLTRPAIPRRACQAGSYLEGLSRGGSPDEAREHFRTWPVKTRPWLQPGGEHIRRLPSSARSAPCQLANQAGARRFRGCSSQGVHPNKPSGKCLADGLPSAVHLCAPVMRVQTPHHPPARPIGQAEHLATAARGGLPTNRRSLPVPDPEAKRCRIPEVMYGNNRPDAPSGIC